MKKYLLVALLLVLAPQAHAYTITPSTGGTPSTSFSVSGSHGATIIANPSGTIIGIYNVGNGSFSPSNTPDVGTFPAGVYGTYSSVDSFTSLCNGYIGSTLSSAIASCSYASVASFEINAPPPPSGGSMTPALVASAWASGAVDFGEKTLIVLGVLLGILVGLLVFRFGWKNLSKLGVGQDLLGDGKWYVYVKSKKNKNRFY